MENVMNISVQKHLCKLCSGVQAISFTAVKTKLTYLKLLTELKASIGCITLLMASEWPITSWPMSSDRED